MLRHANLAKAVIDNAQSRGEHTALVTEKGARSYRELVDLITRFAVMVKAQGLRPGDRICLFLPNGQELAVSLLGASLVRGIVVPLNANFKTEEIQYFVNNSEPTLVACDRRVESELKTLHQAGAIGFSPEGRIILSDEVTALLDNQKEPALQPIQESWDVSDNFLIGYTSGTTGKPKGTLISHYQMMTEAEALARTYGIGPDDNILCAQPLFLTSTLLMGLLWPLYLGGTACVQTRLNVELFLDWVEQYGISMTFGVPTLYHALQSIGEGRNLRGLRYCVYGGSPMPDSIKHNLECRYGLRMVQAYGGTEVPCAATINLSGRNPKSPGKPLDHMLIEILDERDQPLGSNQIGEVCVRAKDDRYQLVNGYWRMPEETQQTFGSGFLRTGDLGYLDEEGFLYLVARKKDMIKVSGFSVFPAEIEQVIDQYPGIEDCAVVGMPDERQGEVPVAFVTLSNEAQLDESHFLTWVKERVVGYKAVKRAFVLAAMPRTPQGKIAKAELRKMLAEGSLPDTSGEKRAGV
ncbi:MAG: hypothetical protein EPO21_02910 [Chloroflexota bacterium]|nr:MAG: hypothetical protein EPO21_02910 [Chloroflexota bacterium]